jgi:hypothetical protein
VRALDAIATFEFVAALVAFPIVIVMWFRRPDRGVPLCGAVVFAILIGTFMCTSSTSQSWGQVRVLDALDLCSAANCSVLINGREVPDAGEVLNTLKELHDLPAHHSSPGKRFSIAVRGSAEVSLVLARDSGDPREYWVFYPKYWITRNNEIGRLKTAVFDAY